jgi:hypothetical protein
VVKHWWSNRLGQTPVDTNSSGQTLGVQTEVEKQRWSNSDNQTKMVKQRRSNTWRSNSGSKTEVDKHWLTNSGGQTAVVKQRW